LFFFAVFAQVLHADDVDPASTVREPSLILPSTNALPFPDTNAVTRAATTSGSSVPQDALSASALDEHLRTELELARHYRHIRMPREAEPLLIDLLSDSSPESIKQQALLELAMAVRESGDLPRAQQIYAQYLNRWPNDVLVPEILLRQGRLFRDMGMNNLALAKFYAVMTSSLVLKNDKMDYYQRLVLSAQIEIAETHFQLGKYNEAADFFSRLLKQANPALNRASAQYRLIRSLSALDRSAETVAEGQDFLAHFPDAPEQPEVRFHVALSLKRLGRNGEALQQVLTLLQEQKERTRQHPELWAYWQQQAGNEIGNQLYREGDYVRALNIYLALSKLDSQPAWQLPVGYQIGLTYERLAQPAKALESYHDVLEGESRLGTNATPGTKALFEMARWRADFVQWQAKAETTRVAGPDEVAPLASQNKATASPETSQP
jgi:tetratricopeptide (TPR) repeat protein